MLANPTHSLPRGYPCNTFILASLLGKSEQKSKYGGVEKMEALIGKFWMSYLHKSMALVMLLTKFADRAIVVHEYPFLVSFATGLIVCN